MNPYSSQQDRNLCFGVLTPLIEESLVHNCSMAALLCQILQQHFINEVKNAIDFDSEGVSTGKRHCKSEDKERNLRNLCNKVSEAAFNISSTLKRSTPKANSIFHLAFVKAFLYVVCPMLHTSDPKNDRVLLITNMLNNVLTGVTFHSSNEDLQKGLQELVLKEFRKRMSINELMLAFKEGFLGNLFPSLKNRCILSDHLPLSNSLGFDPFATYKESYHSARKYLITLSDEEMVTNLPDHLEIDMQTLCFAVSVVLYLPRSLVISEKSKKVALTIKKKFSKKEGSMMKLTLALATNNFSKLGSSSTLSMMVLTPNTSRIAVFASSIAIHLAGVLESMDISKCPLARYCKYPESCTEKRRVYSLCAIK